MVKVLIENNVFVDAQTKDWSTPLYLAVQSNHQDIVQFLLDKNGKSLKDASNFGWAVIHVAAENGNVTLAKMLLNRGRRD